jgi:hypothetical protein
MNKRFAQIITDATDPQTGRVDRARLFSALEADPSDPTAAMFDAAAFTFETVEELKSTLPLAATERMKKLLDYHEASQQAHADQIKDAASFAAGATRDLRKWSEEYWALAITETRKQIDSMRASAITSAVNAANATKDAEKALRKYSDELFEGKSEMTKNRRELLDESAKIAEKIGTASIVLLLMAFAFGIFVGAGISRFSW